ncbi:hypothetical protein FHS85_002893 [Rhodoligotrophos appendicifer]|uniref:hypothetical protein n=1 Tax=Rhodoligotrophos appendicifer TaxID=987056 RepID=UPI001186B382|nr:hypothetical protein [Rhodoligotrophos appendicifer]
MIRPLAKFHTRSVTVAADIDWQTFGLGILFDQGACTRIISLQLGPIELWACIDRPVEALNDH